MEGTLQAAGLPVDLSRDIALQDRTVFFGRLDLKPARRHRVTIEGAAYSYDGDAAVNRTITFAGRTFSISDRVLSNADLKYFFAGYQFDVVTGDRGHLGFQLGGALLDANGTLRSATTGLSGTRSERIGLPLVGTSIRLRPWRLFVIDAGAKGMALGGYGHFVTAEGHGGVVLGPLTVRAGYQALDADIHEDRSSGTRSGIAPRFSGPVFSVLFRY